MWKTKKSIVVVVCLLEPASLSTHLICIVTMTQDQWQLWRSQWREDGLQSVCDQSCTWLTSATTSYTALRWWVRLYHIFYHIFYHILHALCSNMISAPWLQHRNLFHPTTGTRIAKDWWLVWGHGDLRDQIDGQGRTISACSTLLQTYARLIMWSTIGQNPYISASFKPFPSLPILHKILEFYFLMLIN